MVAPDRAVELSAGRGARMLELQALTRLSGLDAGSPGGDRASLRLKAVYDAFTEGHATAPLTEAAAVLSAGG